MTIVGTYVYSSRANIESSNSKVFTRKNCNGWILSMTTSRVGIVYLRMQGACSGCPSSKGKLQMGIENMLKHYVPEVKEVRPIDV